MRHIGHLPDEKQGNAFGDFLVAKGIPNEIEAEANGSSMIWIIDDDQLAAAQAWLEKFRADPNSAEFRDAATLAAKTRKIEAKEKAEYQRRVRTRKSLFVKFGGYGVGILTYTLIGICVVVMFYSDWGKNEKFLQHLYIDEPGQSLSGFLPDVFQHGEFWRLLTPIFIHGGVLHFLFNMMWLYQLGCMIEARQSSLHLLLLVVVTGVFSNVAQYLAGGPHFGGMSGVVYALAGYVWMRGKHDRASGLGIDQQSITILLIWLVVCFTGFVGPVANMAHLAGLASGMAIGRVSAYLAMRKPE
ncbi:MAG TPA: rhomboid family intramembrane serine protease [Verrucomicrobiae bacterium]|nr:rhomboid family intramembrane serine protease [Verrucomicrobiae bacterium]